MYFITEFADLQQDIKLVTSDVIRHGVPYKELSHYTYAMLFPADIMAENSLLNHSQVSLFYIFYGHGINKYNINNIIISYNIK